MDTVLLGRRIAQAREDAQMTQDNLGRAVHLDRSAISRLEKGERKIVVPELVRIAEVLGRPLAYFVAEPVPAVVSRRRDSQHAHEVTRRLDSELELFAADVRDLLDRGWLVSPDRPSYRIPKNHDAAERVALSVRKSLSLGEGALQDLARVCERLGLFAYAAAVGGADGACVEVQSRNGAAGVAVIDGAADPGRRRMTLAHELGHWLVGDAYDREASADSERMINSFAVHFLAPRAGVTKVWGEHTRWPNRDRALVIGAEFRLSWSATIGHLSNLSLIGREDHSLLAAREPRRGDYSRLGLTWVEELAAPSLSPAFSAAVLNALVEGALTQDRALELLRSTLAPNELPDTRPLALDQVRKAFAGHGG